jgi:hypothetical protein
MKAAPKMAKVELRYSEASASQVDRCQILREYAQDDIGREISGAGEIL